MEKKLETATNQEFAAILSLVSVGEHPKGLDRRASISRKDQSFLLEVLKEAHRRIVSIPDYQEPID